MTKLTLIIGNKNYSSWSLRPWLVLKILGVGFEEIRVPLYTPASRTELLRYSPSGKVPVLWDGDLRIWDSLAICEYLAERHPENQLWPADARARAWARSVSAEMHSGFAALRTQMGMNIRRAPLTRTPSLEVQEDIDRITEIWRECRNRHAGHGPFLFGGFSIADAMYAPVTFRYVTYGVALDPVCKAYVETMQALPAMQEWAAAARLEAESIAQFET